MKKKLLKILLIIILVIVFIPRINQAKSEESYAAKGKINYCGKNIQTFYLGDTIYIKLRDFLYCLEKQNDDLVKYDGKSNSVILNTESKGLRMQNIINMKPVKQDGKIKPIKSSHKLIVDSKQNIDEKKRLEVKGMQMYLLEGSNYVPLKEVCEIYKISMSQQNGDIILNNNKGSLNNYGKFIIDKKTIRYRDVSVKIITDELLETKSFILVGKLKEDVLATISKNIMNDKPKDLLKNEPSKGTVIVSIKDDKNNDLTFTFVPENKIEGKYYVLYRLGNSGTKYKNLSINVGEKILDLLTTYN